MLLSRPITTITQVSRVHTTLMHPDKYQVSCKRLQSIIT